MHKLELYTEVKEGEPIVIPAELLTPFVGKVVHIAIQFYEKGEEPPQGWKDGVKRLDLANKLSQHDNNN